KHLQTTFHSLIRPALGSPPGVNPFETSATSKAYFSAVSMYRCQMCGAVVPPRTPCHRLVVQTRPARYPFRPEVNRVGRWVNGKPKERWTDDPGGSGPQVFREVNACPACANRPAAPARDNEPVRPVSSP